MPKTGCCTSAEPLREPKAPSQSQCPPITNFVLSIVGVGFFASAGYLLAKGIPAKNILFISTGSVTAAAGLFAEGRLFYVYTKKSKSPLQEEIEKEEEEQIAASAPSPQNQSPPSRKRTKSDVEQPPSSPSPSPEPEAEPEVEPTVNPPTLKEWVDRYAAAEDRQKTEIITFFKEKIRLSANVAEEFATLVAENHPELFALTINEQGEPLVSDQFFADYASYYETLPSVSGALLFRVVQLREIEERIEDVDRFMISLPEEKQSDFFRAWLASRIGQGSKEKMDQLLGELDGALGLKGKLSSVGMDWFLVHGQDSDVAIYAWARIVDHFDAQGTVFGLASIYNTIKELAKKTLFIEALSAGCLASLYSDLTEEEQRTFVKELSFDKMVMLYQAVSHAERMKIAHTIDANQWHALFKRLTFAQKKELLNEASEQKRDELFKQFETSFIHKIRVNEGALSVEKRASIRRVLSEMEEMDRYFLGQLSIPSLLEGEGYSSAICYAAIQIAIHKKLSFDQLLEIGNTIKTQEGRDQFCLALWGHTPLIEALRKNRRRNKQYGARLVNVKALRNGGAAETPSSLERLGKKMFALFKKEGSSQTVQEYANEVGFEIGLVKGKDITIKEKTIPLEVTKEGEEDLEFDAATV